MALSDAVKRRILKANAIGEHRISALSEQDFIDLASRHGELKSLQQMEHLHRSLHRLLHHSQILQSIGDRNQLMRHLVNEKQKTL